MMRHTELLQDLLEKEKKQKAQIWQEAETEAAKIRNSSQERVAAARESHACRQHLACEEIRIAARMAAKKKADQIVILAQQQLADTLYAVARDVLKDLRDDRYEEQLERLAKELPPEQWATIQVNPLDTDLATRLFPGAAIRSDQAIIGGLSATSSDGGLTIINTLEKRLERGWHDMAADLLATLSKQGSP